jgi:hypothetical protein
MCSYIFLLLPLLQPNQDIEIEALQFHQALYWAAVTLTTVGYGRRCQQWCPLLHHYTNDMDCLCMCSMSTAFDFRKLQQLFVQALHTAPDDAGSTESMQHIWKYALYSDMAMYHRHFCICSPHQNEVMRD